MAKDKANRPKARLPRGFADRTPAEIRATLELTETIRKVYERWGFEPVETPLVEYADALGKFLPDQDRPNEGVFAFQDDDEQWLSLRYDLTAPLARYVAENYERLPKPYKSYRAGWVFRNEKPGPGRFRQFMQFDADTVGSGSPLADAEIAMMAADTMEALGFARGEYVIRVNSRKILDQVLDAVGLAGAEHSAKRLAVLRAIDKADKFPVEDIVSLLSSGRRDQSGDFTPGAGLTDAQIDPIIRIFVQASANAIAIYGNIELPPDTHVFALAGRQAPEPVRMIFSEKISDDQRFYVDNFQTLDFVGAQLDNIGASFEGLNELGSIIAGCQAAGFGSRRVRADLSVVRGLEYYTGAVFEAELRFEITDEDGRPVRFGSVGGGGRYDGLVGRFRGEDVPATGFSVGVSRLAAALAARRKGAEAAKGPVVVTVMDRDQVGAYQALTAQLRAALNTNGAVVPVEMYIGESGMKAQLKYADRRNAPCVVIQGSDERARGVVQVKDLAAGAAAAAAIEDREAWVAARPAQVEVPATVEAIAAEVRRILG